MKIMDRLMNEFLQDRHPDGFPSSADEEALVGIIVHEFDEWCQQHVDPETLAQLKGELEGKALDELLRRWRSASALGSHTAAWSGPGRTGRAR